MKALGIIWNGLRHLYHRIVQWPFAGAWVQRVGDALYPPLARWWQLRGWLNRDVPRRPAEAIQTALPSLNPLTNASDAPLPPRVQVFYQALQAGFARHHP